jgi:hypothetical protein
MYESATMGWGREEDSAVIAYVKHLFLRDVKVIFGSFMQSLTGPQYAASFFQLKVDPADYGKVYGEDYCILPYVPGDEAGMVAWGENIRAVTPTDYYGTSLDDLSMFDNINTMVDIPYYVITGGNIPSYEGGIRQWVTPYGTQAVGVISSTFRPYLSPYLDTGQLQGLLVGSRGGAEYELLIGRPGLGLALMDSLSIAITITLIALIVGNISEIGKMLRRGS